MNSSTVHSFGFACLVLAMGCEPPGAPPAGSGEAPAPAASDAPVKVVIQPEVDSTVGRALPFRDRTPTSPTQEYLWGGLSAGFAPASLQGS